MPTENNNKKQKHKVKVASVTEVARTKAFRGAYYII